MVRRSGSAAALGLVGIAGLHLMWGLGSSVPFRSRADLADSVVGCPQMPGPAACQLVAVSLLGAGALTVDLPVFPPRARRIGRAVVATTLIARGVIGLAGRTDLVSPASTSPKFRRLDRAVYAPLCLALGAAVATAVRAHPTAQKSRLDIRRSAAGGQQTQR